ncbi:hypothetical protein ACOYW6_08035 [Parablastomonas sp. CN1-191]|uniref:hypothetical protein n=1 Tax=Parablastomonas sp. CN1-191 TaxID=3400908 RepID=UPI003BF9019E
MLAAGAAALAAVAVLAAATGPVLAEADWRAGARLAPFDWQVQNHAVTQAIAVRDAPAAIGHALRSFLANPLNAKALTVVGSTRTGVAGTRLLNQSAALGWRDPLTNYRLIYEAIREGDPVIAAQRVDAIGRTVGSDAAARYADRVLTMRGGIEAMADRAAHHLGPGWMPAWIARPPAQQGLVALRSEFVSRIDSGDGPWKRAMIKAAGEGFGKGGGTQAHALWRRSLANEALFAGPVYDSAFTLPLEPTPLGGEWQVSGTSPLAVENLRPAGLVLTAGGDAQGSVLAQTGPAQTALAIEARWSGPREFVAALRWRYLCAETSQSSVIASEPVREGDQWVQRGSFQPAANCRLGILALELARPVTPGSSVTLISVSPG